MKASPRTSDLVATEAELPPGVDAPSPAAERRRIAENRSTPADLAQEIRQLADRVGGFQRLRELVNQTEAAR
jgi:hypothetical protein